MVRSVRQGTGTRSARRGGLLGVGLGALVGLAVSAGFVGCGGSAPGIGDGLDEVEVIDASPEVAGPTERHELEVTLDPPGVSTLNGWTVMNRYGSWETDGLGKVTMEVARVGLTLSIVVPPGVAAQDPRVPSAMVVPTLLLPEELPPERLSVSVREGAVGLMLLDPRFSSLDLGLLRAVMTNAQSHALVARLAEAIDLRFDARGIRPLLSEAEVLAGLDAASDALLAATGPWQAWPGTGVLPRDGRRGEVRIERLSDPRRAIVEVTPVVGEGGGVDRLRIENLEGHGHLVRVEVRRLDVDAGEVARLADLGSAELAVVRGAATESWLTDGATEIPWSGEAVEVVATIDDGPRAEARLAREVAARTFIAPGACESLPGGFLAALTAEASCRAPDSFELAAGARLTRLAEVVGARTLERWRTRAAGSDEFAGLDAMAAWTGFRAAVQDRVRVAGPGAFLAKPVVTVGVAAGGALEAGTWVGVSGAMVGRAETALFVRDGLGRVVPVTLSEGAGSAGRGFVLPEGLAGALVLVAETADGVGEAPIGELPVEIMAVWPTVLDRAREVRLEGRGLFPGARVVVGGASVTLGEETGTDEAWVVLDPAAVGVGVHELGSARLTVPAGLEVESVQLVGDGDAVASGALFSVRLFGVAEDGEVRAELRREGEVVPVTVWMVTRAGEEAAVAEGDARDAVMVSLELGAVAAGSWELALTSGGREAVVPLEVTAPVTLWSRTIEFLATSAADQTLMFGQALGMASGSFAVLGTFQRVNMGFQIGGQWHCPLDVEPESVSIPPASCPAIYERCDEGWIYDDQRDATRWWRVTRPPGRGSTGVRCPVIAGPSSWVGVPLADIADTVTTSAAMNIRGTLAARNAALVMPNARGGGLVVSAPGVDVRSDVALDLVVSDAVSTVNEPVVTVNAATGVTIRRLEVRGRTGACRVALRLVGARDVRIDELHVEGCDNAVEIVGSSDVRVGTVERPAIALGSVESFQVIDSENVVLQMRAGTYPDAGSPDGVTRVPTGRGVLVIDSERVAIGGSGAGLVMESVVVRDSSGVRIGPFEAGVARAPDGRSVIAGMGNSHGIRIEGASRDVRIERTTSVAASFGIEVRGESEVFIGRTAVGGVDEGFGYGPVSDQPLGNFMGGLRIFGGEVTVDGLVVSRNGLFGIGVFGGRARLSGVRTTSRAGERVFGGAQQCAVEVGGGLVTVRGATLVEDEVGVCASLARVRVLGSEIEANAAGIESDRARLEVIGSRLAGPVGLEVLRGEARVWRVEVTADGDGIVVGGDGDPVVLGLVEVDAGDAAVAVRGGERRRVWLDEVEAVGGLGLEVSGSDAGGAVVSVAGGSLAGDGAALDVKVAGAAVTLDGAAWARAELVDGTMRVDDVAGATGERALSLGGRVDVAARWTAERAVRVEQVEDELVSGRLEMAGGVSTIELLATIEGDAAIDGSMDVILDYQTIRRLDVDGAQRVIVRDSRLEGPARLDGVAEVGLVDVTSTGRVTVSGGTRHWLGRVRAAGGVALEGWAQAAMFDVWPIAGGVGVPTGTVMWGTPRLHPEAPGADDAILVMSDLPDRAQVALAWNRRPEGGAQELVRVGQAFAVGGMARLVYDLEALVRLGVGVGSGEWLVSATTIDGASGPWTRTGGAGSCEVEEGPAEDRAWLGDLRWETAEGWSGTESSLVGDVVELAACGERVASVRGGSPMVLRVGESELMTAARIGELRFDGACGALAWVGDDGSGVDVYTADLTSGVVLRRTADAAIESGPAWSADGTGLYFARPVGARRGLAYLDLLTGETRTVLAVAGADLGSPVPSPDGSMVAMLVCGASCRLAALAAGGVWSWLDGTDHGGEGPCLAADPRWVETSGVPLLVFLRAHYEGVMQVVTASPAGMVRGSVLHGVTRLR